MLTKAAFWLDLDRNILFVVHAAGKAAHSLVLTVTSVPESALIDNKTTNRQQNMNEFYIVSTN